MDYLASALATVAGMLAGWIWYGPATIIGLMGR